MLFIRLLSLVVIYVIVDNDCVDVDDCDVIVVDDDNDDNDNNNKQSIT